MSDDPATAKRQSVRSATDPLWNAAAGAVEKAVGQIADDVTRRQGLRNQWTQALRAMEEGRLDSVSRLLSDERFVASADLYPQLAVTLKHLRLAVQRALEGQRTDVLKAVEEAATQLGWRVQSSSPEKVVVDGLIPVSIENHGTVKVGSKLVRSTESAAVVSALTEEHGRVWERARAGVDSFAKELEGLVEAGRRDADPQGYVRLRDLYNALKSRRPQRPGKFASYFKDEFSADLSALAQHGSYRRRFQFSAARDPELAFQVVLDDGQLYQYGYIRSHAEVPDA